MPPLSCSLRGRDRGNVPNRKGKGKNGWQKTLKDAGPEAAAQVKSTEGDTKGMGGSPGFGASAAEDPPQAQQPQQPGGGGAPGTGSPGGK
jgi:hypothetical protein